MADIGLSIANGLVASSVAGATGGGGATGAAGATGATGPTGATGAVVGSGVTARVASGVPSGAPTGTEGPVALDTTAVTGGLYVWNGAAWVKGSLIS